MRFMLNVLNFFGRRSLQVSPARRRTPSPTQYSILLQSTDRELHRADLKLKNKPEFQQRRFAVNRASDLETGPAARFTYLLLNTRQTFGTVSFDRFLSVTLNYGHSPKPSPSMKPTRERTEARRHTVAGRDASPRERSWSLRPNSTPPDRDSDVGRDHDQTRFLHRRPVRRKPSRLDLKYLPSPLVDPHSHRQN